MHYETKVGLFFKYLNREQCFHLEEYLCVFSMVLVKWSIICDNSFPATMVLASGMLLPFGAGLYWKILRKLYVSQQRAGSLGKKEKDRARLHVLHSVEENKK